MHIQQFVMAYQVEQDRLRALLPDGFQSLRPVLRINAEVCDGISACVEFNTAAEFQGVKGWVNIGHWENIPFRQEGKTVTFETGFLTISFTGVGISGSCPAEKDNGGCFFFREHWQLRPAEVITANKEFCDCEFIWHFAPNDARGKSMGKTLPAVPSPVKTIYPKADLTPENAAAIACQQVLGSYQVEFVR